ncbi:MAG: PAS domain-containing sensor histidine kinase [Gallionellaceae bacterium]|jgi:PAS domain S-box-containing protein|nr:PAS domain-containing sensor histidine kinase [Gallionellaceae bacterium]
MTDIMARKRTEAKAQEIECQLKATLNAIPDLLFEVGLSGRYYDYYTSRPELLAVPPEAFLGKTAQEFLSPEAANVATQALHEANEKGTSLGKQIKLKLPKGTMWFELSIARKPVAAGDEPRFIVLSRDITERKKLEKEIQQQRNEMEELQKLHVASMTTAAIAHELNQPLLAIASYSQAALIMLQAGKPNLDKVRKAIEGSEQQAHRAGKAIRELLNFLSLKEFTSEAFDLNREIVDVLNAEKTEHEMQFHSILKLEQQLPLVLANRSHVQRVLRNLLRNGIEAMQQAGVPLPSITVIVRTIKDEGVAQITIIDNGPGLKKEAIHRLFEPFFTSKPNGIGMGLAISRSLIETNGGQLWVDPQEGPGATFHLTLPFAT